MKRNEQSELTVITRAKELGMYILVVTDKSPKKYRFTLVSRLQNYSLDVIEELYEANSIILNDKLTEDKALRRGEHQQNAMTKLRLLAYIAMVARESQCILPDQHRIIGEKIFETQKLLYSWEKSDESRINKILDETR